MISLRKLLLTQAMMFIATFATHAADITDAAGYFTNMPFGWATCSSADGTAYTLDGGQRSSSPKEIVLYASGSDDCQKFINAVKNYDIIILDGSKGDFKFSQNAKIYSQTNKTIIGRNNARLCTSWYITPEIKQGLIDANLDQYSSVSTGNTVKLSNGVEVAEEREYYTRQALLDLTGDDSESYRKAGILTMNSTNENIIIRNITFVGPGCVDISGSDLVSNYGGTHIWIDHCEFIDGLDGNLDSGKREGSEQFVTYSWNIFRYTDRSFSHPYSNGVGWNKGYLQYITYANNIWGDGCKRRLPQADWVYIHLFNNYYNCAGNDVAIAVNANSHALVEGNYAESGVSKPFSPGSYSDLYYVARNNYGFGSYNNKSNTTTSLEVPYSYNKVDVANVPALLNAAHGAGATLDDAMPSEQAITPDVDPTTVTTSKTWDFTVWSSATIANLAADTNNWIENASNTGCYNNVFTNVSGLTLTANGTTIAETDGLLFKVVAAGNLQLYTSGKSSMRLNKNTMTITIPNLKAEDKITITLRTANSNEERGVNVSNASPAQCLGIGSSSEPYSATFTVSADGDVTLTPTGGIYIHTISVEGKNSVSTAISPKAVDHEEQPAYNLYGQRVEPTSKGLVIWKGKKIYNK